MGLTDLKFQVEGVAATNHSSCQKTRLNDLSYGIKVWTDCFSVLSQFTRLTDRQTEFSLLDRVCIPYSAVKMTVNHTRNENYAAGAVLLPKPQKNDGRATELQH